MNNSRESILPPGACVGPYELSRVLGMGSYGAVYEARDLTRGARVALKVLHPEHVTHAQIVQRFEREARMMAVLKHPHIVEVLAVGREGATPYMAMEFLEGESLKSRLRHVGAFSVRDTVDLLVPALSALALVHDRGIVHRDLKPDNLFVTHAHGVDHIKLLDFGVAKVRDPGHSLTHTSALLGTPLYMSPEQARESKHVDACSDQWAMGVILFECVAGDVPFTGSALWEVCRNIIERPTPSLRARNPDVPAAFDDVIRRALGKSPDERFPDVRTLGRALLPFASDGVATEFERDLHGGVANTLLSFRSPEVTVVEVTPIPYAPPTETVPRPPLPLVPGTLTPGTLTPSSQLISAPGEEPSSLRSRHGFYALAIVSLALALSVAIVTFSTRPREVVTVTPNQPAPHPVSPTARPVSPAAQPPPATPPASPVPVAVAPPVPPSVPTPVPISRRVTRSGAATRSAAPRRATPPASSATQVPVRADSWRDTPVGSL